MAPQPMEARIAPSTTMIRPTRLSLTRWRAVYSLLAGVTQLVNCNKRLDLQTGGGSSAVDAEASTLIAALTDRIDQEATALMIESCRLYTRKPPSN